MIYDLRKWWHQLLHKKYLKVEIHDAPNCSHYINGNATDSIPVTICTKCKREVW